MGVAFKEYKHTPYKPPPFQDPFKRPYEDPFKRPYDDPLKRQYEPYKPTHVGIYGEKQRERKIRKPQTPPKFVKKPREPIVTYNCYRNPTGPDIKVGDLGPDYKVTKYEPTPYKPSKSLEIRNTYIDPFKYRPHVYEPPKKQTTTSSSIRYKLTEDNYPPFRNWKMGEINETVALGPRPLRQKNYSVAEKPRPKQDTPTPAVQRQPKSFTSSSTQYPVLVTKNAPTQTNVINRTTTTQTTPLPPVNVVPVTNVAKSSRPPQNSTGTQYSPPVTPVYSQPIKSQTPRRTSSIVQRTPSPLERVFVQPIETKAQQTGRHSRSPSPIVPVIVPLTASMPSTTPIEKAPVTQQQAPSYPAYISKLPPEVNAHIEAYNSVHMPGEARSSIQRTLKFL